MHLLAERWSRARRRAGSLMIELVVATAIIAIGLFALVMTTPMQIRSIKRAHAVNYMTEIARERMDYLRSKPFNFFDNPSQSVTIRMTDNDKVVTKTFSIQTQVDLYNFTTFLHQAASSADISTSGATKKIVWVRVSDPSDRIRPPREVQMETTMVRKYGE